MTSKPLMLFEADNDGYANGAVAVIMKKVKENGGFTRTVSDLAHIVSTLNDVKRSNIPISSVDLIGHGSPGELSVGASLRGVRESPDAGGRTRHHVLNSDPHAYTDLHALVNMDPPLLSDEVPLRLLGCHTASNGHRGSRHERREIDGRVLLFVLANMLECEVQGTTDFINPSDFESAFTKQDSLRGIGTKDTITVIDKAVALAPALASAPSSHLMPEPPLGEDALPRAGSDPDQRVVSSDIDISGGAVKVVESDVSVSEAELRVILSSYRNSGLVYPKADNNLLAIELVFKLPNGTRLEILSRGRYLRWARTDGSTALFSVPNEAARGDLVDKVHRKVGKLESWIL